MADVVEEVPAKVEEVVESGEDEESDADSIPELEETEAGAGGEYTGCFFFNWDPPKYHKFYW